MIMSWNYSKFPFHSCCYLYPVPVFSHLAHIAPEFLKIYLTQSILWFAGTQDNGELIEMLSHLPNALYCTDTKCVASLSNRFWSICQTRIFSLNVSQRLKGYWLSLPLLAAIFLVFRINAAEFTRTLGYIYIYIYTFFLLFFVFCFLQVVFIVIIIFFVCVQLFFLVLSAIGVGVSILICL